MLLFTSIFESGNPLIINYDQISSIFHAGEYALLHMANGDKYNIPADDVQRMVDGLKLIPLNIEKKPTL